MKTIGILGGMSWESTSTYYTGLNRGIKERLGGLHSAKIVLHSVNFAEIADMQHKGDWQGMSAILGNAAKQLELAGADFILIATNTMHKIANEIAQHLSIPIMHIADPTAQAIINQDLKRIALLGTRFTMMEGFYKNRLSQGFGIDVLVPEEHEQTLIHNVIYDELCLGKVKSSSKAAYLNIINMLVKRGAEGVILGCTEIALLVSQQDVNIPLFNTTELHVKAAIEASLQG